MTYFGDSAFMSHWNDTTYTVENPFIIDLEDYIFDHVNSGVCGQKDTKKSKDVKFQTRLKGLEQRNRCTPENVVKNGLKKRQIDIYLISPHLQNSGIPPARRKE